LSLTVSKGPVHLNVLYYRFLAVSGLRLSSEKFKLVHLTTSVMDGCAQRVYWGTQVVRATVLCTKLLDVRH